MDSLGIYFGTTFISLVQSAKKKITSTVKVPRASISSGESELEEKVPDDVKIVTAFKEEFKKQNIASTDAAIVLSGKDVIVRTFEMPILPASEMQSALNFEAKKYIPFKLEELILDYQLSYDKSNRKKLVLLAAIKKETLDKYIAIFNQLDLRVASIDYSAFSVLRLLKAGGFKDKGVIALVSSDLAEDEEINFLVMQNGFPLFSRDIILAEEEKSEAAETAAQETPDRLEKLKGELRVSLDFYKRKFPTKSIEKIFFFVNESSKGELAAFMRERGLFSNFIEPQKYVQGAFPYSMSLFKAYGGSLFKTAKTEIKIDLLAAKAKSRALAKQEPVKIDASVLMEGMRLQPKYIVLGVLLCAGIYAYGYYQKMPLQKEIAQILDTRPKITSAPQDSDYESLTQLNLNFKNKLETLHKVVKEQLYLTEQLNAIPRLLPDGIWLTDFTFSQDENARFSLTLQGMAYLGDNDLELQLTNKFLSGMKEDPSFSKYFKNVNLTSIDHRDLENFKVTVFVIACTS